MGESIDKLIDQWVNGTSPHTERAYRRYARQMLEQLGKPIDEITLADLQAFAAYLETLQNKASSRQRTLSAIKSLFAFAHRIGRLPADPARELRLPTLRDALAERILEEHDVRRLIAAADAPRDHLIITLLYRSGLRVSELVALTWSDVHAHRGAGQLTIYGKGGKTRIVRLDAGTWKALQAARPATSPATSPIFVSRRGCAMDETTVRRIVKAAAERAGVTTKVSPHWLRHCHASHALDNGAPVHLVQQSLGHASIATTSRYLHARPGQGSSDFLPAVS